MTDSQCIFMIGIGGIGMSALAQLYVSEGNEVLGTDHGGTSPSTSMLKGQGIKIFDTHTAENIPEGTDLVVYSDAISPDNVERLEASKRGIQQLSYFEALGEVTKERDTVAISGTHGKTTTTALLTKIIVDAGKNPTAVIGSIVSEFGSNYVQGDGVFIVEACEYKNHLLKLSPRILVITNLEWDHTDFFSSLDEMQSSFKQAIEKVPKDGVIITDTSNTNIAPLLEGARATIIDYTKESVPGLQLLGEFNKQNAQAARSAARAMFPDLSEEKVQKSLSEFKGTWRRFEMKGKTKEGFSVYDDYAHHPTAVRETLKAIREKFADNKIIVAFHPHLFSRTRDLMDEFALALKEADEVVLAPIYPAREEPIEGVTSEVLAEKISALGTSAQAVASLDEVESTLRAFSTDYKLHSTDCLFITMGAGDIYKVADSIVV